MKKLLLLGALCLLPPLARADVPLNSLPSAKVPYYGDESVDCDQLNTPSQRCYLIDVRSLPSDTVTLSANAYTSVATDLNQMMLVTTGASNATVTFMAAASAGDGRIECIRKKDTAAGTLTVIDGSTNIALFWVQNDVACFRSDGTNWIALWWEIAPQMTQFTASGSYTPPPLLKSVDVDLYESGGSGASGRRGAAGTNRGGGGGGASGTTTHDRIPVAQILAAAAGGGGVIAVTVGAATTGGAAVTIDDTDGNPGAAPNQTTFGSMASARGGTAASGGSTAVGAGGTAVPANSSLGLGQVAGGTSSLSTAGAAGNPSTTGSGAAGGSVDSANGAHFGGTGGLGSAPSFTRPTAGTAGAPGNGGNGGSISSTGQYGGSGGGGGSGTAAGVGGTGGDGGAPGGGGGGGGASVDTNNSGAGGAGARGEARITANF